MDLYHFPVSPYSHKVRLCLIEKDISHNAIPVIFFDPEQGRRFKEIHPIGKLPLLVNNDDKIPESSIIVEYLDMHFGGHRFIPEDPKASLEVRLKDRWVDQYLSDAAITVFFQMMKPEAQRDQVRVAKCQHFLRSSYDYVENALQGKSEQQFYFYGDDWTLADIALLPALRIAKNVMNFENHKLIDKYFAMHSERDAFKLITPEADNALQELLAFLSK
ncbi:Stringent starvation protein A [Thalassocella blandensis]|nr:Stringent starvation protein A [Thalassocella blandensis]